MKKLIAVFLCLYLATAAIASESSVFVWEAEKVEVSKIERLAGMVAGALFVGAGASALITSNIFGVQALGLLGIIGGTNAIVNYKQIDYKKLSDFDLKLKQE